MQSHTASGAWQVASIAYTASKLLSGNGIFIKSACIINMIIMSTIILKSISFFLWLWDYEHMFGYVLLEVAF